MATLTKSQTRYKQRSQIVRFFSDQRKWTPYIFVAPFLITFAIFQFYPLLRSVLMGFQEMVGFAGNWSWVGLANFKEALTDDYRLAIAIRNFVVYTVFSLVTQVPVAIILALTLASPVLKWRGTFRTIFFIPSVLPGVAMGVVGIWFFNESRGLANALLAALGMKEILWTSLPQYIMPRLLTIAFWQFMGYHAIFFLAGMGGIDRQIIEAAIIDGATVWQRTRYVVLPLLRPVLAFVTITIVLGSLMIYDVPAIMMDPGAMGGPGGQGWFFIPYITDTAFNKFRMGYATSIGWLIFLLAILVTFFQLKLYNIGEID
jgi:ABC-type sugar transport system permease subunit